MFEYLTRDITQGSLYKLAGQRDDVCTLDLREGSEVYEMFGPKVTVVFIYTLEERKKLEADPNCLNDVPNVKAKGLVFLFGKGKDKAEYFLKEGIPIKDIVSVFAIHYTLDNNTYANDGKRTLEILEVPFEVSPNGGDIGWVYGFLCKQKERGVGLMPSYEDEYLACKYLLEKDQLTQDERNLIYNKHGRVGNESIAYHIMWWLKEAGKLTDAQERIFSALRQKRIKERMSILNEELKKIGIPFNKFRKDYTDQAVVITKLLLTYNDRSFNTTGKHPLYMDFKGFLHIYLRHVDVVNMGEQLARKDKFQLYEKDVIRMIEHVMHALNDDYQKFRDANPDKKFRRIGDNAFYCRGDYYEVYVDKNGRLETFYKASRNPAK